MQSIQSRLNLALLFTALFLFAFGATTVVSRFALGNAAGFSALLRNVAQIVALLAAVAFVVSTAIVAIRAALQPGDWKRKLLYVLPAYFLGFTFAGVILALLGIGTTGPFITTWLAVGGVLSLVTLFMAVGRMNLGAQTLSRAMKGLGIAAGLSLIAWLGLVISIVIALMNPARPLPGGPAEAQGVATPAGSTIQSAPAVSGTLTTPGEPAGQEGPGRRAPSRAPVLIGGGLMTLFAALELFSIVRGWRLVQTTAAEPSASTSPATRLDYGREAGRAVLIGLTITLIALIIIQLVPVSHDNPPPQTAVQWDSPQTQNLARRACMDCHSNETTWPWYSYIAPGSWLLASHVRSGREELNFSELNNLRAFRRASLPNQLARDIRDDIMPPKDYLLTHPEAKLTDAEKVQLIEGLQKSLTQSLPK